jgi:uncharacterized membrane protein
MPLSEQEQRLLDEMERNLYHNDADFVATVGPRRRPNVTVVVLGILGALVGIGVLLVGVSLQLLPVGVLGFVLMFAGALVAIAPPRRLTGAEPRRQPTAKAPRP